MGDEGTYCGPEQTGSAAVDVAAVALIAVSYPGDTFSDPGLLES